MREVSSILSYVHYFKKMRFCYFCRSWSKINIIFGLICKKTYVVGRYFLQKHVHNKGSGFEYVEKLLIFYTSME